MLERHELEAFVILAEELHFGRTAARMHVSTARVSQTIKQLELRTGLTLFHRSSRQVELSEAGRRLLEEVGPAWAQIVAAVERAIREGREAAAVLRVAFTGPASGQLVVGAAERLADLEPGVAVEIHEIQEGDVIPWLRDRRADLVLTSFPVGAPDVVAGPVLVTEPQMLAVPSGHPLARRRTASLDDLADMPVVEARSAAEGLTLVGAGRGVLLVGAHARRYAARPDVAYVALRGAPLLEWGLVWHRDVVNARVRAFARVARELTQAPAPARRRRAGPS